MRFTQSRVRVTLLRFIFVVPSQVRLYAVVGAAGFTVGVTRTISTVTGPLQKIWIGILCHEIWMAASMNNRNYFFQV